MLPILYPKDDQRTCPAIKNRIYNVILVDESRSMQSILDETLDGINSAIDNIKRYANKYQAIEQYITLATFNGRHYRVHMDCRPAPRASALKPDEFCPKSSTPLFDAIGQAVMSLKRHVRPTDGVIVTIITDGEENSSTTFSGADIKRLVEDLSQKGWLFTFIGANQDVIRNAENIGIRHSMSFDTTRDGTKEMWQKEYKALDGLYGRIIDDDNEFSVFYNLADIITGESKSDKNFFDCN